MIKLSYEELPRINQDTMQFIAGSINVITRFGKWDEYHKILYITGGLEALHCTGSMYKRNWQYKEKFNIATWIAVMNVFNMYDLNNKTALAPFVLGSKDD